MIRGKGLDPAGGAVDPDPRAHLDGVAFDAALKLLIAVMRQPDRAAGKKHRGERDIEHERRMVAPAKAAADIGELGVDARRLERSAGLAEQERDRLGGLVGRLNAEHEFEFAVLGVVPAETAFRLEKHRIDGLGLEGRGRAPASPGSSHRVQRVSARHGPRPCHRAPGFPCANGVHTGRAESWIRAGVTQPA